MPTANSTANHSTERSAEQRPDEDDQRRHADQQHERLQPVGVRMPGHHIPPTNAAHRESKRPERPRFRNRRQPCRLIGVVDQRGQRPSARHVGQPGQLLAAPGRRTARPWPWPWRCPSTARSSASASASSVVVLDRAGQQLTQPVGVRAGLVQRIQHRQGVHAFAQVGAGQLARLVGIAVDVDDVVGDLERGADDAAQPAQPLDLVVVGAGEHRRRTRPEAAIRQAVFS